MDDGAIMERLRAIDATLHRIEGERMKALEDQQRGQELRVSAVERWQAATDAMLESINERVDANCDRIDKVETKTVQWLSAHQSILDKQEGGMSARAKTFVDLTVLVGVLVALVKLFVFHN